MYCLYYIVTQYIYIYTHIYIYVCVCVCVCERVCVCVFMYAYIKNYILIQKCIACKSLWIKASAICINVYVYIYTYIYIYIYIYFIFYLLVFIGIYLVELWSLRSACRWISVRDEWKRWLPGPRLWSCACASEHSALGGRWWHRLWGRTTCPGTPLRSNSWTRSVWWSEWTSGSGQKKRLRVIF